MVRENRPVLAIADENTNIKKTIILLAAPALFEGFSRVITQYVDTAMVGSIGSYATAAVGINMSVLFLLWGIMQAAATAFSVMVADAIGGQKIERRNAVIRHAITASIWLGIVLSMAMIVLGDFVPLWLGAAEDVAPAAIIYLRIVGGAAFFQSVSIVTSGLLRGAGNTRTPFVVNLLANIFNIFGNLILIPQPYVLSIGSLQLSMYGAGLGVTGAAIATAASLVFSAVLMVALFKLDNPEVMLFGFFKHENRLMSEAATLGVPVAFERIVLAVGQIILTVMVANLGTAAMAAHHIANSVAMLSFEAATGFAVACTTIIAQCKGAQKFELARIYMTQALKIGVCVTIAFSAIVFIWANLFTQIFTIDLGVAASARVLVRIDAVCEPIFAIAIILCGVFRGYGDTKFPFIVSVVGFLGTRLIFGYILAYALGMGLLGIWIAIALDIITRALMCIWHMRSV